jgi:hypothetical protein
MCNVKTKVVPVSTEATGSLSRSIQKIPGQHTGQALNQEMTENSYNGYCTRTSQRADIKVLNI